MGRRPPEPPNNGERKILLGEKEKLEIPDSD